MNKIKLGDVMGHYFRQRVRENLPENQTFKTEPEPQTSLTQIREAECSWEQEEPSVKVLRQKSTSGIQRTEGESTRLKSVRNEEAGAEELRGRRGRWALAGHHESNGKLLKDCGKTTDITQSEFLKVTLAGKCKKWFGKRPKTRGWNTTQEATVQSG